MMKQVLLEILTFGLRVVAMAMPKRGYVLCCPPVPEGNRGDQAMNVACTHRLLELSDRPLTMVTTSMNKPDSLVNMPRVKLVEHLQVFFASGNAMREELAFARLVMNKKAVLILGADVVDGSYGQARSTGTIQALTRAGKVGTPARLLGFSVSQSPSGKFIESLKALPRNTRLMVRDPQSLARLQAQGVPHTTLVSDTAFGLKPTPHEKLEPTVKAFMDQHAGNLVGINLTENLLGEQAEDQDKLAHFAQAFVQAALSTGVKYLLIAHTVRGVVYTQKFHKTIEAIMPGVSYLIDPVPCAADLKAIAGQCRHVFTCRMHLAIATLGMGRPVTAFPYLGKFEGLFDHFGLSHEGLFYIDRLPQDAGELGSRIHQRIEASEALASQITQKLPTVKALSERNFEEL